MSAVHEVRCGNVLIKINQLSDGRYRFKHKVGDTWKAVTTANLDKIKRQAFRVARAADKGEIELANLTAEKREIALWAIRSGLTLDQLKGLHKDRALACDMTIDHAVAEFLALKRRNEGRSTRYLDGLTNDLTKFCDSFSGLAMVTITAKDVERWLSGMSVGPRRRNNLRQTLVTLWRWAKTRQYVPDVTTEPEKVERAKIRRKSVEIYSRRDLEILLREVGKPFRLWVAIAAWAGVRTEEMYAPTKSDKSPLDWRDVDLERGLITIRPETSKTGKRRLVPICEALGATLSAERKESGPVCGRTPPSSKETQRLAGFLPGGWKTNALRHSFGSYRAAVVKNIGQVSLEMGNSQAMCLSHYHEAVTEQEGLEWFRPIQSLPEPP